MDADEVARSYDAWARTYDDDANATRDLDAAVLRSAGLELAGRDVVEPGCGTGRNTEFLSRHARSVVGLDFSPGMLARARHRVAGGHVRFVQHDIRVPWPLATQSADVVVADLVLEHVRRLDEVFPEMVRVLRPGGDVHLCELHPERQRRGGQAQFRDETTGATRLVPAHRHTAPEYVNAGIAAGLQLVRMGEWLEDGAPADAPPRLLSLHFRKLPGSRATT